MGRFSCASVEPAGSNDENNNEEENKQDELYWIAKGKMLSDYDKPDALRKSLEIPQNDKERLIQTYERDLRANLKILADTFVVAFQ